MENFRRFDAGPDPFGRTWQVLFKWIQNGIAIRRTDTVDVKFVMQAEGEEQQKLVALPHPMVVALAQESGVPITDAWCARLAAMHLKLAIETGEDLEKEILTPSMNEVRAYHAQLREAGLTQDVPYLPVVSRG